HEVEILETSRKIWLRDVLQQTFRDWIDLGKCVVRERKACGGIDDFHRVSGWSACGVGPLRKVSLPLQHARATCKLVEGIGSAPCVVVGEEKCFRSAVIKLWNVERTSHGAAESAAEVFGFDYLRTA